MLNNYVVSEDQDLFFRTIPVREASHDSGKLEQVMARRSSDSPDAVMLDSVRLLLEGVGEDPDREGLQDTPKRVAKMLREVTSGYEVDLDSVINGAMFSESYGAPVVVKDITYYSLCEHHMLPFYGKAHVAYIPGEKVVGLSKIPRVVEVFARRLQVQERLTHQIADFLSAKLEPVGIAVALEGTHFCAVMRGVSQPSSLMRTEVVLAEDENVRKQLLGLISD
ncbi:MAG: GTP cyclohydrolase I FolE [Anaerolineales bacterium]|jgi:GTP cyclohydrolase I